MAPPARISQTELTRSRIRSTAAAAARARPWGGAVGERPIMEGLAPSSPAELVATQFDPMAGARPTDNLRHSAASNGDCNESIVVHVTW
jgi:hypothetical protein